jgi:hypothetical protein
MHDDNFPSITSESMSEFSRDRAMSEFGISSDLATQTLAEIAEIDRRIASLVELRDGLKRVFANVSEIALAEAAHLHPSRSRSAVTEHIIMEMLKRANGRSLKTRELFEGARTISAHLKYVTFRSYLYRLKQRGVITAGNADYGSWRLSRSAQGAGDDHPVFAQ